ncbi:FUSC family protein [Flavobacterium seoulense]|uniref:Membrane protein n=1 Tax=Flavobacterium seoulense TaxID=1492738 RepID=A0A066WUT4_9FLAO|nr:FUSC family membrane protein [Flavobacterium seoulense]KDN56323.1 membrane protein [Flavobacterium seoulense]
MTSKIQKFISGTDFSNALKITIASVFPVLLFSYFDHFQIGFTIALGAFFTFPSDIPSNFRHKINGLLVTSLIIAGVNLIVNLCYSFSLLFYPVLIVLLFCISMISVYGQRATMVSFSALLSISLAFAHLSTGWEMLRYAGLLFTGGLFYTFISIIFFYIKPHRYVELQMAECIRLTAKYLKLRGDLWELNSNRKAITKKQLHYQVELNVLHENIREVLITNRTNSGPSGQSRKMLLSFISLVEILELAISTSFDHNKLHQKFDDYPKALETYQNLAYNLGSTLRSLSQSIHDRKPYESKQNLIEDLQKFESVIIDYKKDLKADSSSEEVLMLITMLHYAEKQVEKIKTLERAYTDDINSKDLKGRDKDIEKFFKTQYYPLSTFVENLSFSSSVFRHSLRLTITILLGYMIGKVLPLENVYWIILTIVVIMKQGFGITNERTYHRIFGTLAGSLIAFGILYVVHDSYIISTMAIIAMLLGFSFNPSNYKIGATFITIYVILIYGVLTPDNGNVIEYRILDTIIGAMLCFFANYFFWPSWEFLNLPSYIRNAIEANRNYLKQISYLYNKKGEVSTEYRLARKQAFIEIGNLMASFERMLQEPKSKQNKIDQVYKLTVLNHSLLSSTASLGTYIQSHATTEASKAFNVVVDKVIENLEFAIIILSNPYPDTNLIASNEDFDQRLIELKNIRSKELKQVKLIDEEAYQIKMQEAQLVIEQLVWMTSLSENIIKTTEVLKGIKKETH